MKEKENTVPTTRRKKLIYSVIVAVCALLLIVATVLTVYFVAGNKHEVLEAPPVTDDPPAENDPPADKGDPEPSDPTGGQTAAYIMPVEGAESTVTHNAYYGNTTLDKWYFHKGVDYAAEEGADIRAIADGEITCIDLSERLGNVVTVKHADGVESTYRFIEPAEGLKEGDSVKQGQVIGKVASAYGTEAKDGTHLHFEMSIEGKRVDPTSYLDVILEEK